MTRTLRFLAAGVVGATMMVGTATAQSHQGGRSSGGRSGQMQTASSRGTGSQPGRGTGPQSTLGGGKPNPNGGGGKPNPNGGGKPNPNGGGKPNPNGGGGKPNPNGGGKPNPNGGGKPNPNGGGGKPNPNGGGGKPNPNGGGNSPSHPNGSINVTIRPTIGRGRGTTWVNGGGPTYLPSVGGTTVTELSGGVSAGGVGTSTSNYPPPVDAPQQMDRYLRIKNNSGERLRVFVQHYSQTASGEWAWLPSRPADNGQPITYDFEPGEDAVLSTAQGGLAAHCVRLWARSASGLEWADFRNADLYLVPEQDANGDRYYRAADRETFSFSFDR